MAMDPRPLSPTQSQLRFLTCGSVDDGKSTLLGRMIFETGGISDDQLAVLRADSQQFGTVNGDLDYALICDGLEAEREQGITIDVSWRYFSTSKRAFLVADAPGHEQYTRNMASAASQVDLAVLLVDATKGVVLQTRRHAAIARLLGIREFLVAVNKMDLVDYREQAFREVEASFSAMAETLGIRSSALIPISAGRGDNVAAPSKHMHWYSGPSILDWLETATVSSMQGSQSFRFPVQRVVRPNSSFRGFSGTISSGKVRVGDSVVVARSGESSKVSRIVTLDADLAESETGQAVTLVLEDEVDIGRGDIISLPGDRPTLTRRFAADAVVFDDSFEVGRSYLLKLGATTVPAKVLRVLDAFDTTTMRRERAESLILNAIGRIWIETSLPLAVDPYEMVRDTGALLLIDRSSFSTVAAGLVIASLDLATNVHRQHLDVTANMRAEQNGQKPLVVWLTGLPAAGKSTIANLVERKLHALGHRTMLLDGDNLRQGLNADLGFDAGSRSENVRRVGEVAKLMVDAGLITVVALVSPFREDRARAAAMLPEGRFLEVFVDTPLEVCRQRDSKGLYRKAASGLAMEVTGVQQGYEPPESPAVVLRTAEVGAEAAAEILLSEILARI